MPSQLNLVTATGTAIRPWIPDAARLRIAVFREYPYLYDGTLDYEENYLRTYSDAANSLFVVVRDGERVVGVSTGVPMSEETGEVSVPFANAGIDPGTVFYFGESVLLPEYRGRGIGVRFFHERENFARTLPGIRLATFCAVDRSADHPARPAGYTPLDDFWTKRGFTKTAIQTEFTWKETGEAQETPKKLTFWTKSLA